MANWRNYRNLDKASSGRKLLVLSIRNGVQVFSHPMFLQAGFRINPYLYKFCYTLKFVFLLLQ